MKIRKFILYTLTLGLVVTSCNKNSKSGGGTKKFTSTSGWKPNQKNGWFFTGKQQNKGKTWHNMVYVEGGTFTKGLVKDDVMHDWNNTPVRTQVRSFFIGETEVTNYEYREYVTWLKVAFPSENELYREIYNGALPDTVVWDNKLSRNDIYSEDYFRSPQFDYYPVVGVSWLQAQRYCEWLTDRANEYTLMQKGIVNKNLYEDDNAIGANSFSLEKYKYADPEIEAYIDKDKIAKSQGISSKNERILAANRSAISTSVPKFRLPTEAEWEYSAVASADNRKYNAVQGREVQINKMRVNKGREEGQFTDNFKYGYGDYSGISGSPTDGSAITNDVRRYPANPLGLYGMYGNVAEWTEDIYRPTIDEEANDFNYFRGNVYQSYIKTEDGSFEKYTDEDIQFDTLANGRIVYKGLPGSFKKEVIENAVNFRDGDYQSSLQASLGRAVVDSSTLDYNAYNAPQRKFRVDDKGRVILEKDSDVRTTDVSNRSRVIKGGSWNDTSYWLDAGQRRYLDEDEAGNWIGFRLAQDFRGADSGNRKTVRGANTKPPK